MILETTQLKDIAGFADKDERLAIIRRDQPDADHFFDALLTCDLETFGLVSCDEAEKGIQSLFKPSLPTSAIQHAFFPEWVADIAELCRLFGRLLKSDHVSVWLGTSRGCSRYHIDNVPMRLVVTYAGRGTEWLPEEAANRDAYTAGAPNEAILTNPNDRQWLGTWDVGIFKGGRDGVLHRTPDDVLHQRSIFLRIDHANYWSGVSKQHQSYTAAPSA